VGIGAAGSGRLLDFEFGPSVSPPATFGGLGAHGAFLAVGDGVHGVLFHALFLQEALRGIGSPLSECQVVLLGATLVAVTFDGEGNADGVGALDVLGEDLAGRGGEGGFVEVEVHTLELAGPDADAIGAFLAGATGTGLAAGLLLGHALLADALLVRRAIAVGPAFAAASAGLGTFVLPALAAGAIHVALAAAGLFDAGVVCRADLAGIAGLGNTVVVASALTAELVHAVFAMFLAMLFVLAIGILGAASYGEKSYGRDGHRKDSPENALIHCASSS